MKKVLSTLTIALVGGFTAIGIYKVLEETPEQSNQITTITESTPIQRVNFNNRFEATGELDFTNAASLTVNSVVHVNTEIMSTYHDPWRDFLYGKGSGRYQVPSRSSGSGVIISDDGYIVTNNHVIDKAETIRITLNDNKTYDGKVVGTDPATDLALVKIKANNLPFVGFGNSDELKIGEWVLAVGNPFNLTSTVTAGIVSAKGRNINLLEYNPNKDIFPIESFIQTDAAVNPGNSGGALVDTKGNLVGINTAIASRTGSYSGYSFAVPANIVKKVTQDLMEFGSVQRGFIGVSINPMTEQLAEQLGYNEVNGVYINGLTAGGAALDAGIKKGDIIVKIGNLNVDNMPELQEQLGKFRPGDKINVTVKRSGKRLTIPVILRNKEGETKLIGNKTEVKEVTSLLGANLEKVSNDELSALNLNNGVKVKSLTGGKLRKAGIKEGFIITKIDQTKVNSSEEVNNLLSSKSGGVLIEGVYPNGLKAYYGFGM